MINILKRIRKLCKQKIIVPLVSLVICLLILALCPFYNTFNPPSVDNIFALEYSDSCVNITLKNLYYTGYDLSTFTSGNFGYYYVLENDECRFVAIPYDKSPKDFIEEYSFNGKIIKQNKAFKQMLSYFSKDINWNQSDLSKICGDFIVSRADYHPIRYIALLWIVLIVLLLSLKQFIGYLIGIINPELYPVCTFLGKKEQASLIEDAQYELDSENFLQINSMYITENYFIDFGKRKISIIPLNDIVWCYRLGNRSFYRSSKHSYTLFFTILSGAVITAKGKTSDEALELINAIHATEYDIIIGHSDNKRKAARKIIKEYKEYLKTELQ